MTKEKIKELANIMQISLTEDETEALLIQIKDVIKYASTINDYPCVAEELQFMTDNFNRFREDIHFDSIASSDALKNAPKRNESFFKVPKVVE